MDCCAATNYLKASHKLGIFSLFHPMSLFQWTTLVYD